MAQSLDKQHIQEVAIKDATNLILYGDQSTFSAMDDGLIELSTPAEYRLYKKCLKAELTSFVDALVDSAQQAWKDIEAEGPS